MGGFQRIRLLSPEGEVLGTRSLARSFLFRHASAILADGRLRHIPGTGVGAIFDIVDDRILAVRRYKLGLPAVVMIELSKRQCFSGRNHRSGSTRR